MNILACAFTGHRPARFSFGYNEGDKRCLEIKALLREWIEAYIAGGIKVFYSGMALGTDQWAASIVLDMKKKYEDVQLIAVLPCETQANNWSEEQRRIYFDILAKCDDVVTLKKHYDSSCMFERNRYIVDHAKHLLAVYDGSERGGTAYTVRYAEQKKLRVAVIHPDTFEVTTITDIKAFHRRGKFNVVKGNK